MLRRLVRIIEQTNLNTNLHQASTSKMRWAGKNEPKKLLKEGLKCGDIQGLDVIPKCEDITTDLRELRAQRAPSIELSFRHRPMKECKKKERNTARPHEQGKIVKRLFCPNFFRNWYSEGQYVSYIFKFWCESTWRAVGEVRSPGENSERKEWQRMLSFSGGRIFHFQGGGAKKHLWLKVFLGEEYNKNKSKWFFQTLYY